MNTEKFCLRWNDFEHNISNAFRELRDDKDFFDVTLACDDEQVQAHKVILSACSSFFHNILRRNPHQHPLLYVKGVKLTDLESVLNFMYHGEVSIAQEELNSFLEVAEDLKVKGLTQTQSSVNQTQRTQHCESNNRARTKAATLSSKQFFSSPTPVVEEQDDVEEVIPIKSEPASLPTHNTQNTEHNTNNAQDSELSGAVTPYQVGEFEDYQEQSYMQVTETGQGSTTQVFQDYVARSGHSSGWQCTICGKESAQKVNLVKHVENVHFPDSFSYNCKYCTQSFNTKNKLYVHIARIHKN